jgi:hypothetical protein
MSDLYWEPPRLSSRIRPFADDQAQQDPVEAAGSDVSLLRPFLLTSGRVQPADDLELEAQVVTSELGRRVYPTLAFERRDIIALCCQMLSVAEIAARLHLHLGVVKVLVADLAAAEYLTVHRPLFSPEHDLEVLERVIRGLEAIR